MNKKSKKIMSVNSGKDEERPDYNTESIRNLLMGESLTSRQMKMFEVSSANDKASVISGGTPVNTKNKNSQR